MAASPLAIAAVSAVAAVVLHRGRTKSLREQYTAAKELLSQLTLELEAVQEELQVQHLLHALIQAAPGHMLKLCNRLGLHL